MRDRKQAIQVIGEIVEEMESRYPEGVIAKRIIEAYEAMPDPDVVPAWQLDPGTEGSYACYMTNHMGRLEGIIDRFQPVVEAAQQLSGTYARDDNLVVADIGPLRRALTEADE